MDFNVFPDVPQPFFDTLNRYNWLKATQEKVDKLAFQLRNYLLAKGIPMKRRDWTWYGGPVPTLTIAHDCPAVAIDVLNEFDWQTLPADTTAKMAEDADVFLKLLSGIPRK